MEYGIQLCSIADFLKGNPLEEGLKKVAEMGYKYVEFCGYYDHSAEEVKAMLDEFNLRCPGTHLWIENLFPDKFDETVKFCKTIGCDTVVVPGCDWSTPEKRDKLILDFNEIKEKLENIGMHLAYHNHDSEFMKTGYDIRFADDVLNRSTIDLEVDTFWTLNARVDTIELLNEYKDRVAFLHIKDGITCKEEEIVFGKHRIGVEHRYVGCGENDIKSLHKWATENNILMIVENENRVPSGLDGAQKCIDYLKSLD